MYKAISALVVVLCAGPLAVLPAGAHTLDFPDHVTADVNGTFVVSGQFTAGPGDATVGSWSWIGVENIDAGGLVADCFCSPGCFVADGESLVLGANAGLIDPLQPGTIQFSVGLCSGGSLTVDVLIRPFVVPVEPVTWSTVKARFAHGDRL